MFKRANKITSLLVAAAAVVSLVPTAALASDVKKIDSQEGTVYDAVAYKDGKAVIDGEVDDNDAAYYYADGKYTELDDIDSGAKYQAYGDKYANVDDGDYFVNLEDGTVTDDSVDEDDADDAASSLRKKIKDSDRYVNSVTAYNNQTVFGDTDIADVKLIGQNKFSENWYVANIAEDVTASGNVSKTGLTENSQGYFTVFTNKDGSYIDADYNLGKIKVSTTAAGADNSVTIENTKDTYKLDSASAQDDTYAVIAKSIPLTQDKDNIYRYAVIDITTVADSNKQVFINGKAINAGATGTVTISLPVIQKISKAQDSDDIDDAKYAKTVTNYVISKDNGTNIGANATGDVGTFYDLVTNANNANKVGASLIGGKLVVYNLNNASGSDNVFVQATTLKSKNGFYYTDVEEQTSLEAEYSDDLDRTAFDTDVDGNIYVIDGGYIKEFDGTDDWNKIYKVDGSFDSLSTYDKDTMVAWSQGDEVYSIIGGKSTDDTTPTTPVVTAGWAQAADGTWSYNKADGTKATGWYQDTTGTWYFLNAAGVMQTGWYQDAAGTWYYLTQSGAMATGWFNDNGTWYYLNGSGAMLSNTVVDGYTLGASGAWIQ